MQVRSDLGLTEPAHDRMEAKGSAPNGIHAVEIPEEVARGLPIRLTHLAFRILGEAERSGVPP